MVWGVNECEGEVWRLSLTTDDLSLFLFQGAVTDSYSCRLLHGHGTARGEAEKGTNAAFF